MMTNSPQISWYEGTQNKINEVKNVVSYGTVESDFASAEKVFYIWNNRNSDTDVSTMEEVTFTTKDRDGGTGDTIGNIVEAVRDNWINVKCDTLSEVSFKAVGKSYSHPVGTKGATKNPKVSSATAWSTGIVVTEGSYIKPTADNDFIYKVTVGGTTGGIEPTWRLTAGEVTNDDAVQYVALAKTLTSQKQEILGVANSVLDDGSNAADAGGNWIKLTTYADVPVNASSGKNSFIQRILTSPLIQ